MTPGAVRRLVALHAERLVEAQRMRASAKRSAEPWHAVQCRDLAAAADDDADALAQMLVAAGADVSAPDPRQISLLSLGPPDA